MTNLKGRHVVFPLVANLPKQQVDSLYAMRRRLERQEKSSKK